MVEICNKEFCLKAFWENDKRQENRHSSSSQHSRLRHAHGNRWTIIPGPDPCPGVSWGTVNPGVVRDPNPCPKNDFLNYYPGHIAPSLFSGRYKSFLGVLVGSLNV
jgi:hypothetical protein